MAFETTLDLLMLRRDGVDENQWPRLSCSQTSQAALAGSDLRLDARREVLFQDEGQIRSFDDTHKLVFNRGGNLLELHEQGDIRFLTGGPSPTERLRIRANGQVGLGTATPTQALEVVGTVKATAFQGNGAGLSGIRGTDATKVAKAGDTMTGPLTITATGTGLRITNDAAVGSTLTVMGNVGIGTTTPTAKLDIAQNAALKIGNAYVSSGGAQYAHFASNAWYNGTAWQIPDPSRKSSLLQCVDDNVLIYQTQTAGGGDWKHLASFTSGGLYITGAMQAGNSDVYFTNPTHNHTGIGNTPGFAAIENAANYNTLMILGRTVSTSPFKRSVSVWDELTVYGPIQAGSSDVYFTNPTHNHTGIGNAPGFAAIENSANYNTLMILGRTVSTSPFKRSVSVWDELNVYGPAFKPGGGAWGAASDIRLKQQVRPLTGALDKLLRLRGVSFEWKAPETQGNLTGPQMGMLAHEVEEVFPEWISTDPQGYKQLTVRGFEALVVEALRTLKAAQDQIAGQNQAFETRLGQLEAKLQMESLVTNGHTRGAAR
jgi:Chaperone of endosialidase